MLCNKFLLNQKIFKSSFVNIAKASTSTKPELSYSEKQEKLGRPLSPHVTIYKFPISATTSILNRITGVALSVGKFLTFY